MYAGTTSKSVESLRLRRRANQIFRMVRMRRWFAAGVVQGWSQLVIVGRFEVIDDAEGHRTFGLVAGVADETDDTEEAVGVATGSCVAETTYELAEFGEE